LEKNSIPILFAIFTVTTVTTHACPARCMRSTLTGLTNQTHNHFKCRIASGAALGIARLQLLTAKQRWMQFTGKHNS